MTPDPDGTSPSPEEYVEIATRAVQARGSNVGLHAVVLSGSAKGTVRSIGEKLRVGKAADNDLVLADDTVSRHHCELTRTSDGIRVRDLDSTNGTKVQGARVTEAIVQPGTVLKVGEVEVVDVYKRQVAPRSRRPAWARPDSS